MGIFSSRQPQAPDLRIAELTRLVKEAAAAITILEKEIETKDEKIEKYELIIQQTTAYASDLDARFKEHDRLLQEACDLAEQLLQERDARDVLIQRLRADLKKRTDQYNELIDLAREKGIIGE